MKNMQSVINIIKTLYESDFRGKDKGRFVLTRKQLMQILQVPFLKDEFILDLQCNLILNGLVMINLDLFFPIMDLSPLIKQRRPPKHLLNQITGSEEISDDNED